MHLNKTLAVLLHVLGGLAVTAHAEDPGDLLWAKRAGGGSYDVPRAVAAFPDGSSVVVGHYLASPTFGAGELNETTFFFAMRPAAFVARYDANGSLAWAKHIAGPPGYFGPEASAAAVAPFADGSCVVTGSFVSSVTFGSGEPKETTLVEQGGQHFFVARFEADGSLAWARRAGGIPNGIGALPDGACVVAGYFSGSATFEQGGPNETSLSSYGGDAAFLARFEADGSLAWARRTMASFYYSTYLVPQCTGVSPDGSTVVAGYFSEEGTFGPGDPNETTLLASSLFDAFVARYGADGSLAWAKRLSSTSGWFEYAIPYAASAFPDGSCMVVGVFLGRVTFGPGESGETTLDSPDTDNAFVARLRPDGSLAWAKSLGDPATPFGYAAAYGVGASPDGSCAVTGYFRGSVTFAAGESNETTLVTSSDDAFVTRYLADGSLAWTRQAGTRSDSYAYGYGVTAFQDGSAIAVGTFSGSVRFGAGEAHEVTLAASYYDVFVARYGGENALRILAPASVVLECDGADEGGDQHGTATLHFEVEGTPPATSMLRVIDLTGNRTLLEQAAAAGALDVGPYGFPMGVSTVAIEITDAGQVLASATLDIHVQNSLNFTPVISGVGPKTIELQGPLTTLYRSLLGIEVSDDCGFPVVAFVPAAVALGTTEVIVSAIDASGGAGFARFAVTVVDTTPPVFTTAPTDVAAECVNGRAWVAFDVAASDLSGVVTIACADETGRAVDHAGASFEDGVHTVTCVASDASGNEATWVFTITVRDTTAPVIVCPEDITAPNEPGECFAYVAFAVTATDACDPSVPISTTAPWGPVASGDAFPVGLTEVTCSARDTAGNEATCSFRILVRDVEPPIITCPETAVVYTDATGSPRAITPTDLGATATDNCLGPIVLLCTPSMVSPGTTDIVLTALDGDGNESTCDVSVTVLRQGEVLTPAGSPVTVTPQAVLPSGSQAPVEITFDQVTGGGVTSVMTAPAGPPAPHGFKLGTPPVYYDVTTTAQFTGAVELCFSWVEGQIANERNVRLFHQEGGRWIDVTTSVDTTTNIICGRVSSLSPFIVAEIEYAFEGFLAPLNADGSSLFKAGRTVPLKFRIRGPSGEIVSDATARVRTWRVSSSVTGTVEEEIAADSAGASNEADLFRFDPDTGQYIFNLQTKGWSKGTYRAEARLDDGSVHGAAFSVRE